MSTAKLVSSILVGTFVLFSLIPYGEKTNPKSDPKLALQAPKNVMNILKRSCYDCHSNQTKWPWYSSVFPMSWSIYDHVTNGRRAVNFDLWESYPTEKKLSILDKTIDKINHNRMPLQDYLWFHKEAKLSKADKALLQKWVEQQQDLLQP